MSLDCHHMEVGSGHCWSHLCDNAPRYALPCISAHPREKAITDWNQSGRYLFQDNLPPGPRCPAGGQSTVEP
jgi:hypothetical protein